MIFHNKVDGKGVLNQKNIETDVVALTTDPEWKKITKIVANRCFKEVIGNFIKMKESHCLYLVS